MATSRGYSDVLKERGFVFLLAAQALAVFDDNTFKQLLMLFVTASIPALATRNLYISLGTALYVLPYIVFSSYAGQVADHFSKRRVIIFMKVVEATLLVVATLAMFAGHVIAMLAVLFLLGIHACFLDPAKEGILPQIFPDEALSRANGLMQLTVYTMIVSGPVAAGLAAGCFSFQTLHSRGDAGGHGVVGIGGGHRHQPRPGHRRGREIPLECLPGVLA